MYNETDLEDFFKDLNLKNIGIMSNLRSFFQEKILDNNWLVLVGVLFGAVLRIWGICRRPIWYDEAFSLLFSRAGLAAMLEGTLNLDSTGHVAEEHPLGYYSILSFWMDIFGQSEFAARMLSVIFGVLGLYLVYLMSSLILKPNRRWIPVWFLAISPFHIHYSQEIRMYALMCVMLLTATYALFKGMQDEKIGWWMLFSFASAVAQYSQQLSAVYLVALATIPVLKKDRKAIRNTFLAGLVAIILYLPWLLNLFSQFASLGQYWIDRPFLSRFLTLFLAYVVGLPVRSQWLLVCFAISLLVIVFAMIATIRVFRNKIFTNQLGFWFGYLAFFPPLLLWLISQVRPVYVESALLTSGVMLVVWVGWLVAIAQTPKFEKIFLTGLLVVGSVFGFLEHVEAAGFPYAPYQELGINFIAEMEADEAVVHSNKLSFLPLYYYYPFEFKQRFVADVDGAPSDTLADPTQEIMGIKESASLEVAVGDFNKFYFLIFETAIEEMRLIGVEEHPHLTWLNQRYEVIEMTRWGDLWVYLYSQGD